MPAEMTRRRMRTTAMVAGSSTRRTSRLPAWLRVSGLTLVGGDEAVVWRYHHAANSWWLAGVVVRDNFSTGEGGGVWFGSSGFGGASLVDCTFVHNESGRSGGAVFARGNGGEILIANVILLRTRPAGTKVVGRDLRSRESWSCDDRELKDSREQRRAGWRHLRVHVGQFSKFAIPQFRQRQQQ